MATYLWSDLHFNHEGIIGYCGRTDPTTGRPFATVGAMNAWMAGLWNARVAGEGDTVWVLGDFWFPPRKGGDGWSADEAFHKLRGKKHFVVGNHDEKNRAVLKLPWENARPIVGGGASLPHIVTLRAPTLGDVFGENTGLLLGQTPVRSTRRAELSHYPLETWKGAAKGALMLHGHSHGSLKRVIPHRFDVGVDTELGKSGPIDFETIWEIAQKQPYAAQDHHAEKRPEVEL